MSVPPVGTTVTTAQVQAAGNSVLGAAVVIGILIADDMRGSARSSVGGSDALEFRQALAPDPTRRISVQDCSRPIDPQAGNLVCR